MNRIVIVLAMLAVFLPQVARAFSFPEIPKDRILLTKLSDRILLVDVDKIEISAPTVEKGIESQSVTLRGTVVETVRGEPADAKWEYSGYKAKIVDRDQFREVIKDRDAAELIEASFDLQGDEGFDCKPGGRYLVIYWRRMVFFAPAPMGDESWRKKIQPKRESVPDGADPSR